MADGHMTTTGALRPRTPFILRVKVALVCLALCAGLIAAESIAELANNSWASRMRILPWTFTTQQQKQETQQTYTSNPLEGARIAPVDGNKVPAPR